MTPLPSLPTDNLYKFLFIAGLTLILSGLVFYISQYQIIRKQVDELNIEVAKLDKEKEYSLKDIFNVASEIQELKIKQGKIKKKDKTDINQDLDNIKNNILMDKNYREYLAFVYAHKSEVFPLDHDLLAIKTKHEIIETKIKEIDINSIIINLKKEQKARDNWHLVIIGIISWGFIIFGIIIARNGYKKWYIYLQIPSDEKIKIELQRLKADNP